jgi:hypothetical protein
VTLSPEQLEWIVSEVVRRLRSITTDAPAATTVSSRLAVGDRLITLEALRGRLDGITQLEVPAKAIVTPAVVDMLNERQVQLLRA